MNTGLLDTAEATGLEAKQKHWTQVREKLREKTIEVPALPATRNIDDYPRGRFEIVGHNRLEWMTPNYFLSVPKAKAPFTFIRSTGQHIAAKNFFTNGGSIPRLFGWGAELDP